jgi:hypothetical protein
MACARAPGSRGGAWSAGEDPGNTTNVRPRSFRVAGPLLSTGFSLDKLSNAVHGPPSRPCGPRDDGTGTAFGIIWVRLSVMRRDPRRPRAPRWVQLPSHSPATVGGSADLTAGSDLRRFSKPMRGERQNGRKALASQSLCHSSSVPRWGTCRAVCRAIPPHRSTGSTATYAARCRAVRRIAPP